MRKALRRNLSLMGGAALLLCALLFPMAAMADMAAPTLADAYKKAGIAPADSPRKAPDFTLHALSGKTMSLSGLRGKLVVLNFWATWCGPCTKEMPALNRLFNRMKDEGVVVLAVSLDMTQRSDVENFVNGYRFSFPVLLDPLTDTADLYHIRVLPTTYLIGQDGTILGRAFGPRDWDGADTATLLKTLLNSPPSTH